MTVISVLFRIMDSHINKLSKLCHICLKTVITGGGYINAKTVYIGLSNSIVNLLKIWCNWRQRGESLEDTGVILYCNAEVLEI